MVLTHQFVILKQFHFAGVAQQMIYKFNYVQFVRCCLTAFALQGLAYHLEAVFVLWNGERSTLSRTTRTLPDFVECSRGFFALDAMSLWRLLRYVYERKDSFVAHRALLFPPKLPRANGSGSEFNRNFDVTLGAFHREITHTLSGKNEITCLTSAHFKRPFPHPGRGNTYVQAGSRCASHSADF